MTTNTTNVTSSSFSYLVFSFYHCYCYYYGFFSIFCTWIISMTKNGNNKCLKKPAWKANSCGFLEKIVQERSVQEMCPDIKIPICLQVTRQYKQGDAWRILCFVKWVTTYFPEVLFEISSCSSSRSCSAWRRPRSDAARSCRERSKVKHRLSSSSMSRGTVQCFIMSTQ